MNKAQPFSCQICSKAYEDSQKLRTHMKMKHPDIKYDMILPPKTKYCQQELFELQDKIYAQFGQFVEIYTQKQTDLDQNEDLQRFAGQANYMTNKIVRTPYEDQIQMKNQIPQNIGKEHWQPLLAEFKRQTIDLLKNIEAERDEWQFLDPLDTNINIEDQFSLMDIPKLVKNYKKKVNLDINHPEFCIFVLWIGRLCKAQTWKTFYEYIACLLCEYHDFLIRQQKQKNISTWFDFFNSEKKLQLNIDGYILTQNVHQIREEDLGKLIKYYLTWVVYFCLLPKSDEKIEKTGKQDKKLEKKESQEKYVKLE